MMLSPLILPNAYAVWHVNPDQYVNDGKDPWHGGKVYECFKSPPMIAVDNNHAAFITQDASPFNMYINPSVNPAEDLQVQYQVDYSHLITGSDLGGAGKITGPGTVISPDGQAAWCVLLGNNCALLRLGTNINTANMNVLDLTLYAVGSPAWTNALHLIHLTFAQVPYQQDSTTVVKNMLFTIATDLLDANAINAIVVFLFRDDSWTEIIGRRHSRFRHSSY